MGNAMSSQKPKPYEPTIAVTVENGVVTAITITNPGNGYTSPPKTPWVWWFPEKKKAGC